MRLNHVNICGENATLQSYPTTDKVITPDYELYIAYEVDHACRRICVESVTLSSKTDEGIVKINRNDIFSSGVDIDLGGNSVVVQFENMRASFDRNTLYPNHITVGLEGFAKEPIRIPFVADCFYEVPYLDEDED